MFEVKQYNKRSKVAELTNTTVVYMIGSMLSKVLNFILLPYISIMISTEELGVYDFVQTITGIAVPIITLQVIDSAFRFMYGVAEEERRTVLINVWCVLAFGGLAFLVLGNLLNIFLLHLDYFVLIEVYAISNVLINMYQRVARSYDKKNIYAISGIVQTFTMLVTQLLFLKYTSFQEKGLVYAYAISVVITCIYIEVKVRMLRDIRVNLIDFKIIKKLLKFSVPLVPNSISWWGVSSIGRIIIIAVIGYTANGIYSMSNKFAGLVTMVTSTFLLAFQEYALKEKNDKEESTSSQIFNYYIQLLAIGTSILMLLQQIYFTLFIDVQYVESKLYIPIVMISMFFSSLSSFYGTGYFVYQKTSGAFKSTVIGAGVNVILSVVLVFCFKLWGIALASVIAYLVMCIFRHISMKSYFSLVITTKSIVLSLCVLIVSTIFFYCDSVWVSGIAIVIICLGTLVVYWKSFIQIIQLLSMKIKRKNVE